MGELRRNERKEACRECRRCRMCRRCHRCCDVVEARNGKLFSTRPKQSLLGTGWEVYKREEDLHKRGRSADRPRGDE